MSRLWLPMMILIAALCSGLAAPSAAFAQQAELSVTALEKKLFDLVNAEREKANAGKAANDPARLRPAAPHATIFLIARNHAKNMSVQGMSHVLDGKNSLQRAWDAGISKNAFVGENIASGQTTPEACVADWMASKMGHREAILDPRVKVMGVGVAQSENGTYLWCLNYCGFPALAENPPKLVVLEPKPANAGKPNTPASNPPATVPTTTVPATPPKPPQALVVLLSQEKALLDALNAQRAKAELRPLALNRKLYSAASSHAAAMVKAGGLSHTLDGKNPTDRVKALGYPSAVEEVYNGGAVTAARCVSDWLGDDKLRAKIMDPNVTEIGVGFTQAPDTTNVWNIVLGASPEVANPPRIEVFTPKE